MDDQRREVERETVLDAPAEEVWEALTDERLLGEWLADEAELDPEPGGRASFRFADGTEKEGTVLRVEEERELAFTWASPGEPETEVELTLVPLVSGTPARRRGARQCRDAHRARGRRVGRSPLRPPTGAPAGPCLVAVDAVFAALADPTRRRMVETLAGGSTVTASGLAAELPITRQAVAKHLAALRRARLVSTKRVGRETRYSLDAEPLGDAARWIATVGAEWDERLADLGRLLERR